MDEPYQSKGFGIRVWKVAVASLSDSCNVGGDAVLERVHMYGTIGAKPYWYEQYYD